jgi:hypothetical protein
VQQSLYAAAQPASLNTFTCSSGNDATTCAALGDFYYSLSGPSWIGKDGWAAAAAGTPTDYCTFYLVFCVDGHLRIQLGSNGLSGTLPQSMTNLTTLQWLWLGGNNFAGTIPSWWHNLQSLSAFDLSDCRLTGTIPASFGSMTALNSFGLNNNNLEGTIPASLSSLSLTYINVNNCSLTGGLGPLVGMTSLVVIKASRNSLSGTISSGLSSLTDLQELTLGHNSLSGTVPSALSALSNLQTLCVPMPCFRCARKYRAHTRACTGTSRTTDSAAPFHCRLPA